MGNLWAGAIAALLAIWSPGEASEPVPPGYAVAGHSGETMDELVVRAARSLEMLGKRKNAEVCGTIAQAGDAYQLTVTSIGSNVHCSVRSTAGTVLFHTHVDYMGSRFSPADYAVPGYMIRNGRICWQSGRGTEVVVTRYGRRDGGACAAGR